jgi:hypothetical protein
MCVSRENSDGDSLSAYLTMGYGFEAMNCEFSAIGQEMSDTMPYIGYFLSNGGIHWRCGQSPVTRHGSQKMDVGYR